MRELIASVGSLIFCLALAGHARAASLDLEGTASLSPTGLCTRASCSGIFTATVAGDPIGATSQTLTLNLFLDPRQADMATWCYDTTGYGGLGNGYWSTFVGKICPGYDRFELTGSVKITTGNLCTSPWQAMSGQLSAYGQIHTIGPTPVPSPKPSPKHPANPIWPIDQALVSVVGVAAQLPMPCPSP